MGAHDTSKAERPPLDILLVEDDVDAGEMLEMMLAMKGHRITRVENGERAIREARALRPSVLLCDLGLPDMSGIEVARTLAPELDSTLFLVLSGHDSAEVVGESLAAGFHGHLVKPVAIDALEAAITEARKRHQLD